MRFDRNRARQDLLLGEPYLALHSPGEGKIDVSEARELFPNMQDKRTCISAQACSGDEATSDPHEPHDHQESQRRPVWHRHRGNFTSYRRVYQRAESLSAQPGVALVPSAGRQRCSITANAWTKRPSSSSITNPLAHKLSGAQEKTRGPKEQSRPANKKDILLPFSKRHHVKRHHVKRHDRHTRPHQTDLLTLPEGGSVWG